MELIHMKIFDVLLKLDLDFFLDFLNITQGGGSQGILPHPVFLTCHAIRYLDR